MTSPYPNSPSGREETTSDPNKLETRDDPRKRGTTPAPEASAADCRNVLREIEEREDMHPTQLHDFVVGTRGIVYAEEDKTAGMKARKLQDSETLKLCGLPTSGSPPL
jgi:hypothetical protein